MTDTQERRDRRFLDGGGEMGGRIRAHDWSATPFGPPETWPEPLRTALSLCLDSSFPTAIYWGPELRLLYNDAWAPVPAERHPWALGRPAREVWSDIWPVIEPQFRQVLDSGEGFSTFDQMLPMQREGRVHETYWNYSFTPIRGEDGAVLGIFNQGNETTGRIRAERALRDSEALLRALTDSVDQMIWAAEPDGYHDYFNQRWYDFTGLSYGSTDGEQWAPLVHPDDRQRRDEAWRRSLETGEPYRAEFRLRHRSGAWRWVLGRAQPLRDDEGRVVRWFGTCTDIQEIVEAREVMARSREQLEREVAERTEELLRAEAQLRQAQKMEAVGQLTGGIAHDFNNMLAVILGSLNLLERRLAAGNGDVGKYIEAAKEGTQRAAALTQRLLAFSRQQPLSPETLDANRLVAGMTELLGRTLGEPYPVETVLAAGLWRIHADPNQLESAILNLAVNARDAMAEGGRLTIETANAHIDEAYARDQDVAAGQYVLIAVTDTGSGMTPEVVTRAFDPFFTTKGVGRGTGLGLSQVFGFIRQSGGHVKIYSEPELGTTVKVYLPRWYGADEAAAEAPAPVPPAGGLDGEVVLVVEDDARVRSFSVEALRELGYAVVEAASGPEALRLIEAGQPVSLLFTDVVMPEMTGRELAERALERLPGLKVIYTTGYTRNAVVHNGVLDPGTQFLSKPFSIEQLAAKVRSVLDG